MQRGREILLTGQAPSGALVASPNFPVYRYAWLRDGAFCAQALDLVGEHDAASAFHRWAARAILAHADRAARAMRAVRAGEPHPLYLPTRYTLDGELEPDVDDWPNFQLDGYGIWLHVAAEHLVGAPPSGELADAMRLAADYLAVTWGVSCYDCWEELGDGRHTSTLLAVAGGLRAAARALGDPTYGREADAVTETILAGHVHDGHLTKSRTNRHVDASLLWLGTTFELGTAADEALRLATVREVAAELTVPGGGVRRYLGDSYYGGGEWLLLTSWLGWHATRAGDRPVSDHCDAWVRDQATDDGQLSEQTVDNPQVPDMVDRWTGKWGPVAQPLLWSHAMQMIHSAATVEAGWRRDV